MMHDIPTDMIKIWAAQLAGQPVSPEDPHPRGAKRRTEEELEAGPFKLPRDLTPAREERDCFGMYSELFQKAAQEAEAESVCDSDIIHVAMRLHDPAPAGQLAQAWTAGPALMRMPDTFTAGDAMALAACKAQGAFVPRSIFRRATKKDLVDVGELMQGLSQTVEYKIKMKDSELVHDVVKLNEDADRAVGTPENPLELWVQVQPHGVGTLYTACGYTSRQAHGLRIQGVRGARSSIKVPPSSITSFSSRRGKNASGGRAAKEGGRSATPPPSTEPPVMNATPSAAAAAGQLLALAAPVPLAEPLEAYETFKSPENGSTPDAPPQVIRPEALPPELQEQMNLVLRNAMQHQGVQQAMLLQQQQQEQAALQQQQAAMQQLQAVLQQQQPQQAAMQQPQPQAAVQPQPLAAMQQLQPQPLAAMQQLQPQPQAAMQQLQPQPQAAMQQLQPQAGMQQQLPAIPQLSLPQLSLPQLPQFSLPELSLPPLAPLSLPQLSLPQLPQVADQQQQLEATQQSQQQPQQQPQPPNQQQSAVPSLQKPILVVHKGDDIMYDVQPSLPVFDHLQNPNPTPPEDDDDELTEDADPPPNVQDAQAGAAAALAAVAPLLAAGSRGEKGTSFPRGSNGGRSVGSIKGTGVRAPRPQSVSGGGSSGHGPDLALVQNNQPSLNGTNGQNGGRIGTRSALGRVMRRPARFLVDEIGVDDSADEDYEEQENAEEELASEDEAAARVAGLLDDAEVQDIAATLMQVRAGRAPARQPGQRRARVKYSDEEIHAILDGLLKLTEQQRESAWATIKKDAGILLTKRSNVDLKDKWRNLQLQWYKNELTPELAAKVERVKAKTDHQGAWPVDKVW